MSFRAEKGLRFGVRALCVMTVAAASLGMTGCTDIGLDPCRRPDCVAGPEPPPASTPQVALDFEGNGWVAWNVERQIHVQRFDRHAGFDTERVIHSGTANIEDLRLGIATAGSHLLWVEDDDLFGLDFTSATGGQSPVPIVNQSPIASDPVLAFARTGEGGNVIAGWRHTVQAAGGATTTNAHALLNRSGGGWRANDVLQIDAPGATGGPPIFDLDIASNGDQNAVAIWVRRVRNSQGGDVPAIFAAELSEGVWQPEQQLSVATQTAGDTRVAMNSLGNAVAVWAQDGIVTASLLNHASHLWIQPEIIPTPPDSGPRQEGQVDVALTPLGSAIAVWVNNGGVFVSSRISSWTPAQRVDAIGTGSDAPSFIGNSRQPRVGLDEVGRTRIVWSTSSGSAYTAAREFFEVPFSDAQRLGDTDGPVALAVRNQIAIAAWWRNGLQTRVFSDEALVAGFNFSPAFPRVSDLVVFRSFSTPTGVMHEWDFDGANGFDSNAGPTVTFTYQAPGTYNARLRITDVAGNQREITQPVVVVQPATVPSLVSVSVTGSGTVTFDLPTGDIVCREGGSTECQHTYDAVGSATLIAEPGANQTFVGWGSDCRGFITTRTISLDVGTGQIYDCSAMFTTAQSPQPHVN